MASPSAGFWSELDRVSGQRHIEISLTPSEVAALVHAAGYVLRTTEASEYAYHRDELMEARRVLDNLLRRG